VERSIEGAALGGVYKEVYIVDDRGGHPRIKVAGDKSTYPGIKEVYRLGDFEADVVQLADEPRPHGSERLLKPVVLHGEVVPGSLPPLNEIWELAQSNLRRLPDRYRQVVSPTPYTVRFSQGVCELREQAIAEQRGSGVPVTE
jgi:nicotinate phosphoribosyltransferase